MRHPEIGVQKALLIGCNNQRTSGPVQYAHPLVKQDARA